MKDITMDINDFIKHKREMIDENEKETYGTLTLTGIAPEDCSELFSHRNEEYDNVEDCADIPDYCFYCGINCNVIDVSGVDFSHTKDLSLAFASCLDTKQIIFGEVNAPNLTNMYKTFFCCDLLESVDLGNFNAPNLQNIEEFFRYCCRLRELDLSKLNVCKVTDMENLFANCESLKKIDLSGWNLFNTRTTDFMFENCYNLEEIKGIEDWNVSNTRYLGSMFAGCTSLKNLDLSKWKLNDNANIKDIFYECDFSSFVLPDDKKFECYKEEKDVDLD